RLAGREVVNVLDDDAIKLLPPQPAKKPGRLRRLNSFNGLGAAQRHRHQALSRWRPAEAGGGKTQKYSPLRPPDFAASRVRNAASPASAAADPPRPEES